MVCPDTLWSNRVALLRLTKPLPREFEEPRRKPWRARPWGIVTTTGKRCQLIAAMAGEVRGLPVTYNCADGGILLGYPRQRTAIWTIFYQPDWRSRRVTLVGVSEAWW